ncbi:hypothetical protein D3C81_1719650 [compost metagenome]
MTGERVHIFDQLGLQGSGCCSADTTSERNPHASDLPLKRAQHQLLIAVEVETGPVQVIELIEQKRRELRGIGDEVPLVRQQ